MLGPHQESVVKSSNGRETRKRHSGSRWGMKIGVELGRESKKRVCAQ